MHAHYGADGYHNPVPRQRGTEGVPRIGNGPMMAMSHWTLHEFDTEAQRFRPTGLVFTDKGDAEFVGERMARRSLRGVLVMPFFPSIDRHLRHRWVVLHHHRTDRRWRDTGLSFYFKLSARRAAGRLRAARSGGLNLSFLGSYVAVSRREADHLLGLAAKRVAPDGTAQEQPPA